MMPISTILQCLLWLGVYFLPIGEGLFVDFSNETNWVWSTLEVARLVLNSNIVNREALWPYIYIISPVLSFQGLLCRSFNPNFPSLLACSCSNLAT
jgi:hypothetical protein